MIPPRYHGKYGALPYGAFSSGGVTDPSLTPPAPRPLRPAANLFIWNSGTRSQIAKMIHHLADTRPLQPSDLEVLERALFAACDRRGIDRNGEDAEHIAAELFQLYKYGIRVEQELRALIS